MSALITVLCWGAFIVWLGRHEFSIARERLAAWRAQRDEADRLDECFHRMRGDLDGEQHGRRIV